MLQSIYYIFASIAAICTIIVTLQMQKIKRNTKNDVPKKRMKL